jgi:hypothetical protein
MRRLTDDELQAIAKDLELCAIGEALTKGKARSRFKAHRKACMAAIKADNEALGLPDMTDDELLAALSV